MEQWLSELAKALEVEPLTREEIGEILRAARLVAHGAERRLAPLSAYVIGRAVGERRAKGEDRSEAFAAAVRTVLELLPEGEAGTDDAAAGERRPGHPEDGPGLREESSRTDLP